VIFVDASFWIALGLSRDSRHPAARELFEQYGDEPLLTTMPVVGETWTFLRHRAGHPPAVSIVDGIVRSRRVEVLHVDTAIEDQAIRWLRRHDERSYSFVDATSFAVMRARRIRSALAFDQDFTAAGFVELRPG
jgi:predicted nucleic acid-binding protein